METVSEKITLKNWDGLNFKEIKKYSKELETYNGELPFLLHHHINITHRKEYLDSIGESYEYQHIQEHRKGTIDLEKDKQEIIDWIKENFKYQSILKTK